MHPWNHSPVDLADIELTWRAESPTPGDGTAIRDFVHVADMVTAFVLALHACQPGSWRAYNVGSGRTITVHDVILTAETVTGRPVPRRHTAAAHEPATLMADSNVLLPLTGKSVSV